MKIRMRTLMAGPKGVVQIGQVIEVPEGEGRALVARGFADEVQVAIPVPREVVAPVETATAPAAEETAEAPEGKRGRKGR